MKNLANWPLLGLILFTGCEQKPVTVIITPDKTETLSDCVIILTARADLPKDEEESLTWSWLVNGQPLAGESGPQIAFYRPVDNDTTFEISASANGYQGTGSVKVTVRPFPFLGPEPEYRNFSLRPVLPRGDFGFIDPGAVWKENNRFLSFFNFMTNPPDISIGLAESTDGQEWTLLRGGKNPVLDRKRHSAAAGAIPTNIHGKSVIRAGGAWHLYYTAVPSSDYFFGEIRQASAKDPAAEWRVDPEPALTADRNSWEQGKIGLPQVFETGPDQYRMYYLNAAGDLGLALSDNGTNWTRAPGPLLTGVGKPSLARFSGGWLMVSESRIWLSRDGLEWHRYSRELYTREELAERGLSLVWISALTETDKGWHYYLEAGDQSGSDTWLIRWGY